ncbi:MAG: isoprenylcysteine carboxylmethyltransferase family protein [Anaerolineales bacterium]
MLKIVLPIYTVLFYGIVFFWRSYQTWRKTGVNPYRLQNQDGIHGLASRMWLFLSLSSVVVVVIFTYWDSLYTYLAPIAWLETSWLAGLGLALLFASLIWIFVAQVNMGSAWRIGIDDENLTQLVTGGIFQISRNPIFLGMRLNLLGLFLVLPNAVTLAYWLVGDVMLQVQVLLEEEYLQKAHGDAYQKYTRQVRRWL